MEVIAGGASVLAFVVVGLKSAKVAHEVLSAIKDGSTHVAQARSSVQGLQSTLERLSRCRLVAEQQDGGLLKTAKECADNMEAFAKELKKLAEPQHRVGKQWNKVKIFLKEDDLKRVSAAVVGHTAALNFYLQVLESDTILEVRDDVRAILPVQQSIQETQTTILAQHTTVTTLVQDTMTQNRNDAHATRETIQTSTQGLATQTDIQHINDLLKQLLGLHPSQEAAAAPRIIEIADGGGTQPKVDMDHEDELEATLFFLIEALQNRHGIFADDEAREICDPLLDFLDKAFPSGRLLSLAPGLTGGLDYNDDHDIRALLVNLRAVKGAILSSRQVSVNQEGVPSTNRHYADGKILISRKTRLKKLKTRSGTISVLSTESRSKNNGKYQAPGLLTQNGETMGEIENSVHTTDTRISFIPRLQGCIAKGRGFEAILRKTHGYQGWYHGAIPRLFTNNIIHGNSPVFNVVRKGELAKFHKMLMRGEASLRDQDEYGASLLFYAHMQPDMCRFLLEHGADVDHFAPIPRDRMLTGNALSTYDLPLLQTGHDRVPGIICSGLLLNAGCDPSIRVMDTAFERNWKRWSFFELVCQNGDENLVRMLCTGGFVQAYACSADIRDGKTLLHLYAQGFSPTAMGFSQLLKHGGDITARCSKGWTCLHYLFSDVRSMDTSHRIQLLDACEYLVRSGADVDAVDYSGTSVSMVAYGGPPWSRSAGSGDVWDRVLAGTGFDVASFRARHGVPRRARYNSWYMRSDFEAMWQGMAELCPYYHDSEWLCRRLYSAKSLLGFRSLWQQWGEDVMVGRLEEDDRAVIGFAGLDTSTTTPEQRSGRSKRRIPPTIPLARRATGTMTKMKTATRIATKTAVGKATKTAKTTTTMGIATEDAGSNNLGYISSPELTPKTRSITQSSKIYLFPERDGKGTEACLDIISCTSFVCFLAFLVSPMTSSCIHSSSSSFGWLVGC
ncbi:hypothetical protein B0T18DRAFT_124863 [Schizothecium vesticola]|uniref:Fungal N-terminal domain-containing protein n=1 Tax=Schizothecium vesticola TaxID=314040 RepID=A0AA40K8U8_9PEZI|nr:hypothetical protein B0T18DRAFT_124863 [Schizothecium vesticola]